MRTFVLALSIEGVGTSAENPNGTLFTSEAVDPPSGFWNVVPTLQESGINSVGDEVDPYTNKPRSSRFTFTSHASDAVAELFLYQQTEAPYVLEESIGAGTTAIRLDPVPPTPEDLSFTSIFVGDEAIRLGGWNAGQQAYLSSTRGLFQTRAEPHSEGDRAFTRVPYWRYRKTTLHALLDGELHTLWSGYLTDNARTTPDGLVVSLPAASIIEALKTISLRPEVTEFSTSSTLDPTSTSYLRLERIPTTTTVALRGDLRPGTISDVFPLQDWADTLQLSAYVVDGAVVTTLEGTFWDELPLLGSSFQTELGDDESRKAITTPVHEVAVISPVVDAYVADRWGVSGLSVAPTRILDYPYHPLSIVGSLLLSKRTNTSDAATYDCFGPKMAADMGWAFGPDIYDELTRMIEATSWMEVDHVVIGYERGPISVWERASSLMRQWGFLWGIREDGTLRIWRLQPFDVEELSNSRSRRSDPYDDVLGWSQGKSSALDSITATVGLALWDDPTTIRVQTEGTSRRTSDLANLRDHRIDYDSVSKGNTEFLRSTLVNEAVLRYFAIPRLRIRIPDPLLYEESERPDYSIGSLLSLSDLPIESAWLISPDGKRVREIEDIVGFSGYIINRDIDTTDLTRVVEILLTNYRLNSVIRLRAPSAIIEDIGGGGTFVIEDTEVFGTYEEPTSFFRVGDSIEVWTQGGEIVSFDLVITAIPEPNEIVLSGPDLASIGLGHLLRLGPSTAYENDADPYPGESRPFVFFADDDGLIDLPDSEQDGADIYG